MSPLLTSQWVTALLFLKNRSQKMPLERKEEGHTVKMSKRNVFWTKSRTAAAAEVEVEVPNSKAGRFCSPSVVKLTTGIEFSSLFHLIKNLGAAFKAKWSCLEFLFSSHLGATSVLLLYTSPWEKTAWFPIELFIITVQERGNEKSS